MKYALTLPHSDCSAVYAVGSSHLFVFPPTDLSGLFIFVYLFFSRGFILIKDQLLQNQVLCRMRNTGYHCQKSFLFFSGSALYLCVLGVVYGAVVLVDDCRFVSGLVVFSTMGYSLLIYLSVTLI